MLLNNGHLEKEKYILEISAGTTEYIIIKLKNAVTKEDLDLSTLTNVKWSFGTYSVRAGKILSKDLNNSNISVIKDEYGEYTNQIQIKITPDDTQDLQGGFIHQVHVTDANGDVFLIYDGLLKISKKI